MKWCRQRWAVLVCATAVLVLGKEASGTAQTLSGPAVSPNPSLAVGVAAFEAVAPAGADVPDVGSLLADRLATKGVGQVVGPQALGVKATADPTSEEIQAWAAKARVEALVVGRTTRDGPRLSVEVHLRSGASGQTVAVYAAQVPEADALPGAVDRLADEVIAGWRKARPAVAAVPTSPQEPPGAQAASGGPLAVLGDHKSGFHNDAPISIKSDELEAVQKAKERFFLFTGHVVVKQDNVTVHSDRLEAYYPEGSSQPEKLVAIGHVNIEQEGKTAVCDQATYLNTAQRIFCRGNAELKQGQDSARGKEIELQLDTERMFIRGDALVIMKPKEKDKEPPAVPAEPTAAVGPGGAR